MNLIDELKVLTISGITKRQAYEIGELLGGGSVVWCDGKCYPSSEIYMHLHQGSVNEERDASELVELLKESQGSIGGDWRLRRDKALANWESRDE